MARDEEVGGVVRDEAKEAKVRSTWASGSWAASSVMRRSCRRVVMAETCRQQ